MCRTAHNNISFPSIGPIIDYLNENHPNTPLYRSKAIYRGLCLVHVQLPGKLFIFRIP